MKSFLYLVDASKLHGDAEPDGTNFELLIPRSILDASSFDEVFIELWVAEVRATETALLSRYVVEEISTTYHSGYYLVVGSNVNSTHYRTSNAAVDGYGITDLVREGVQSTSFFSLGKGERDALERLVKSRWKTSLRPHPADKILNLLKKIDAMQERSIVDPAFAISLVKTTYAESELTKSPKDPAWMSPSMSLAKAYLDSMAISVDDEAFFNFEWTGTDENLEFTDRVIRTDLRTITESDCESRTFKWPQVDIPSKNYFDVLHKTERAEARHQQILSDCCRFLKDNGVVPLMNINVDLAYEYEDGFGLCEIKSSTPVNFRDQVLKGFVQILEYSYSFQRAGHVVNQRTVIIDKPCEFFLFDYFQTLLASHSVDLQIYDEKLEWPMRCDFYRPIPQVF